MKDDISFDSRSLLSQQEASRIKHILEYSEAWNTRKAYRSDWQEFEAFSISKDILPIPASPELLLAFIAHLDQLGRKMSTIHRKVYAISKAHQLLKAANPVLDPTVKRLLKGLRRRSANVPLKEAKALRLNDIEQIATHLASQKTPQALRDRVLLLMGFWGGFRRSELAALSWDQLKEHKQGMTLQMQNSKTDQEGKIQHVKIFPSRNTADICPIKSIRAWRLLNPHQHIFVSIDRHGNIKNKALSGTDIYRIIKKYFGKEYSAHSLRAGFVTEAAANGANYSEIQQQTGHKDINTIQKYTRFTDAWEGNAVLKI